jgi:hypothetical protein
MERETRTFKTPSGHSVVIKAYATGREVRNIENKYYQKSKLELVGGQPKITDMDLSAQFEVEQEMIRLLVDSIDGSTDDVTNKILDLRSHDYEAVIAELNEVTKKK